MNLAASCLVAKCRAIDFDLKRDHPDGSRPHCGSAALPNPVSSSAIRGLKLQRRRRSPPPQFVEVLEITVRGPAADGPLFRTPATVGTERAEQPFDTTRQISALSVVFAHVHRIGVRCGASRNTLRDRALATLSRQHDNGTALCVGTDRVQLLRRRDGHFDIVEG